MDTKKVFKVAALIVLLIILGVIIYVIVRPEEKGYEYHEEEKLVNPNKENINAPFVDIKYTRTTTDTEYLTFKANGEFSYSYASGSAVDNYDLCEYYTYDAENETINLVCFDEDGIIKELRIYNASEESIKIDFSGDVRKFTKEVAE